jgi:hypothetical protein
MYGMIKLINFIANMIISKNKKGILQSSSRSLLYSYGLRSIADLFLSGIVLVPIKHHFECRNHEGRHSHRE